MPKAYLYGQVRLVLGASVEEKEKIVFVNFLVYNS
jgi:hypothetical protein